MRRFATEPRHGWRQRVESRGLLFHTVNDEAYWDESAYYEFTAAQVDEIEAATGELNEMCLAAVEQAIGEEMWDRFQIHPGQVPEIRRSWEEDEVTIYGRFDLAYDGVGPPRLLEYNADTPTGLVEAAVIQWDWLREKFPKADQFNSIHERLIEAWRRAKATHAGRLLHVASLSAGDALEDFVTASYMRDVAQQAGWGTKYIPVEEIGHDPEIGRFVDGDGEVISNIFKLYPWEWIAEEGIGELVAGTLAEDDFPVRWYEPAWKALLSNKMLLVLLHEMYPDSPYILPAFDRASRFGPGEKYVRKPQFGREGANTAIVDGDEVVESTPAGDYDTDLIIYQAYQELPSFQGNYPIVGSWMVNGNACGVGIREDKSRITGNTSRFVPHLFV